MEFKEMYLDNKSKVAIGNVGGYKWHCHKPKKSPFAS